MAKNFSVKMDKDSVNISENRKQSKVFPPLFKSTENVVKIEIPPKTIITVLLVIVGIYLLFKLINVLLIIFFALVVASATLPLITSMIRKGFPKWLSISIVYISLITIISVLIALIVSPFVSETGKLAKELTAMTEQSLESIDDFEFPLIGFKGSELKVTMIDYIEEFSKEIVPALFGSAGVLSTTIDALMGVGGLLAILVSILIISLYIVADHDHVVDAILIRVNDDQKRDRIRKLIVDVEYKLGRWLVGQGIVSLVIGVVTWIILTIFNVPFALPIAVAAALLEVVPNLGPVLVSIPMFLIALLAQGPLVALIVIIAYIVLQQLQSYVLTPKIMSGVIGLHPLVVFVGMIAGFTLAGLIGAALAVPSLVLLKIGYEFYKDLQRLKAKGVI